MSKLIMKSRLHLVLALVLTCFSILAYGEQAAMTTTGPVDTSGGLLQEIQKTLEDLRDKIQDYFGISLEGYQKPSIAQTPQIEDSKKLLKAMVDNYKLANGNDYVSLLSTAVQGDQVQLASPGTNQPSLISNGIIDALTSLEDEQNCPRNNDACIQHSRTQVLRKMAGLDISNIYDMQRNMVTNSQFTGALQDRPANRFLNIDTLLSPLAFRDVSSEGGFSSGSSSRPEVDSELAAALAFIKFATHETNPLKLRDILPDPSNPKAQSQRDAYIVKLRNYIASASVGDSNLAYILAKRIRNTNMDKPKSQMEIEHELATRRLNRDWFDKMEKASPTVIQRETLYLLAEINYQMYRASIERERMLATLTLMHTEQLQSFSRSVLEH